MAAYRTFAFRPAVLCALLSAGVASSLHAAVMPVGFTETILTNSLSSATAMAVLPDGRILVTEQGGALRLIKADALVATAVITLTVDPSGERGCSASRSTRASMAPRTRTSTSTTRCPALPRTIGSAASP
jgi:glucose/arabinose dehydrogenase